MKINFRWPAKRGNTLVPWYTILWRLTWWLPIMASLGLTVAFVALSHGLDQAEDFWDRAR